MNTNDFLARWKHRLRQVLATAYAVKEDEIEDVMESSVPPDRVVNDLVFKLNSTDVCSHVPLLNGVNLLLNWYEKQLQEAQGRIRDYEAMQLRPDRFDEAEETEWTLTPGENVWITAGNKGEASIYIQTYNKAILKIETLRTGSENDGSIDGISIPWETFFPVDANGNILSVGDVVNPVDQCFILEREIGQRILFNPSDVLKIIGVNEEKAGTIDLEDEQGRKFYQVETFGFVKGDVIMDMASYDEEMRRKAIRYDDAHATLDAADVPREWNGQTLTLTGRIGLLTDAPGFYEFLKTATEHRKTWYELDEQG